MLRWAVLTGALVGAVLFGLSPVQAQGGCVEFCKQFVIGKRVGTATTANAGACREQCRANSACRAWMYWAAGAPHAGQCEMVGSTYDMSKDISSMNIISGILRR
jgi:hypothetical protein